MRAAVARLGISYPVLIDSELELWQEYENEGWPARYLFDGRARLFDYHYGEGAYAETELAIQELLGVEREPLDAAAPRGRAGRRAGAADRAPARRLQRPLRGGRGVGGARRPRACRVGDRPASVAIASPRRLPADRARRHTAGTLSSSIPAAACICEATCFTPGLADCRAPSDSGDRARRRAQLLARAVLEQAHELGRGGRVAILDEDADAGPVGVLRARPSRGRSSRRSSCRS